MARGQHELVAIRVLGTAIVVPQAPELRAGEMHGDVALDGKARAQLMPNSTLLGNANLLALFAFKPEVGKFVSRAPVDLVEGHTPGGMTLRVLMPAVATFMGCYSFGGLPVVVLGKPMKLPGDGFLGVKFFSAFRVVFDFRHGRLWLRLAD